MNAWCPTAVSACGERWTAAGEQTVVDVANDGVAAAVRMSFVAVASTSSTKGLGVSVITTYFVVSLAVGVVEHSVALL